jgi:hypothetical protein
MGPRAFRCLLTLADSAERRIRLAGRAVPAREYTMSQLAGVAREQARAEKRAEWAEGYLAQCREDLAQAGEAAAAAARELADACIAASPARPRLAEYDPAKFRVSLVRIGDDREAVPAGDLQ